MDRLRIIFYINNKSMFGKKVDINYDYQKDYFKIRVEEKLRELKPKSQGREVLEIDLISKYDLNGVADMHVLIGDTVYDLWLPISFIKFKQT